MMERNPKRASVRDAETLSSRLTYCRRMLGIWGLLTDAEIDKIRKRLAKAIASDQFSDEAK